jgi:hypothetical protein
VLLLLNLLLPALGQQRQLVAAVLQETQQGLPPAVLPLPLYPAVSLAGSLRKAGGCWILQQYPRLLLLLLLVVVLLSAVLL